MDKLLKLFGVVGLMACMLIVGGCGGGGSDGGSAVPATQKRAVTIAGAGIDDAAGADVTYDLQSSEYFYEIQNFGSGDKLIFPAGNAVSVDNQYFDDGFILLSSTTTAGATVTVKLTNLTPAQDAAVSVNDLNTQFGAASVTQK